MRDQGRFFDFLEVIKRAESGEVMKEADYDKRLGKKALSLMKQYEIHFDPQCVIPSDDALADRIFQAAVDLFLDLGVYCTDTQRVIRLLEKNYNGHWKTVLKRSNMEEKKKRFLFTRERWKIREILSVFFLL